MENRITRLIVPIAIGLLAFLVAKTFLFPGSQPASPDTASAERPLDAEKATRPLTVASSAYLAPLATGEPGDTGYVARFHTLGGSLATVDLLDFYRMPRPTAEQRKQIENVYRVIEAEPGVFSFAIEDFLGRFPLRVPGAGGLRRVHEVYWKEVSRSEQELVFELALENGVTLQKVFRFFKGSRRFQLAIRIGNRSRAPDVAGFWIYRLRGAAVLSNPASEWGLFNPAQVFGKFADQTSIGHQGPSGKPNPVDYPDVARGSGLVYAGSGSRFFLCSMFPDDEDSAAAVRAVEAISLPLVDNGVPETQRWSNVAPILQVRQRIPEVPDGKDEAWSEVRLNVYLGPKDGDLIAADPSYAPFLEVLDLDLRSGCCIPGGEQMAKLLLWVLKIFYSFIGNWGVAIILLTVLVRASLLPVNLRQQKAMRSYSQKMQKLKPEMDRIKERHKNNQQRMNQELMKFQRENKLFPPLMGCLPMLLTMPVFIGLFTMLRASFELRHQPFLGWINDLSVPDRFLYLGDLSGIPLLPNLSYLNLLPLVFTTLYVANGFLQTLSEDPQQRSMQRMMRWMPIIFLFLLYNYASGLALYMSVSSLWSLVEMRIVKKKLGMATLTAM